MSRKLSVVAIMVICLSALTFARDFDGDFKRDILKPAIEETKRFEALTPEEKHQEVEEMKDKWTTYEEFLNEIQNQDDSNV